MNLCLKLVLNTLLETLLSFKYSLFIDNILNLVNTACLYAHWHRKINWSISLLSFSPFMLEVFADMIFESHTGHHRCPEFINELSLLYWEYIVWSHSHKTLAIANFALNFLWYFLSLDRGSVILFSPLVLNSLHGHLLYTLTSGDSLY